MNKLSGSLLFALMMTFALPGHALDAAEQRYIDLLSNGGPVSIREAAQSIFNTRETDQQVLDTLAEVLLQNYQHSDRTYIDAMSWAAKALGNSGKNRYHDTLNEVAENGGHKKLRKYAKKSLKQLPGGTEEQYTKGSVSLTALKNNADSGKTTPVAAKSASGELQPISVIKPGMSMQEVYDLVGQPTATTSHQTGKAWIPFNFKGSDNVRTIAIYKGQGRIVFSNESNFSSGWRVNQVQLNENESGYP